MKKEQWLYVVIAILAIWIIASYVSAPKSSTVPEGNNYGTNGTEQTNPVSAIPSSSETQQASVINAGVNINAQVGNEAGPNKGILTASVASNNKVIVSDQLAGNMVKIVPGSPNVPQRPSFERNVRKHDSEKFHRNL